MMQSKNKKVFVAFLCTILVITGVFAVFMPHEHDFLGEHCSVCALVEISRTIFICAGVAFAVWKMSDVAFATPVESLIEICATPVSLKVKLSD